MRHPKILLSVLAAIGITILASSTAFAQETGTVGYDEFAPGRFIATVSGVIGLISAIFAGVNLFRAPKSPEGQRRRANIAGIVGLAVSVYGVIHLAIFTGDFGTGDGRAGAIISIVLGLITAILAIVTLKRRRATK